MSQLQAVQALLGFITVYTGVKVIPLVCTIDGLIQCVQLYWLDNACMPKVILKNSDWD